MSSKHRVLRAGLIVLDGFLGIAAGFGAVLVVPTMPLVYLKGTPFPDYTIPALALALVAVSAFGALIAMVVRPRVGAEMNVVAGLMIMAFEVVEAFAIGSLWALPEGVKASETGPLWLQPFFFAYGLAMIGLGMALWSRILPERSWPARLRGALRVT